MATGFTVFAFAGAAFTGAAFTGAAFTGAAFTEAAFTGAAFTAAVFTEAAFTAAAFTGAAFAGAAFTGEGFAATAFFATRFAAGAALAATAPLALAGLADAGLRLDADGLKCEGDRLEVELRAASSNMSCTSFNRAIPTELSGPPAETTRLAKSLVSRIESAEAMRNNSGRAPMAPTGSTVIMRACSRTRCLNCSSVRVWSSIRRSVRIRL